MLRKIMQGVVLVILLTQRPRATLPRRRGVQQHPLKGLRMDIVTARTTESSSMPLG
jgi:hypothetical protein